MNVVFIPVRGGSKSIPLKNIKEIAGRPLVYWTVRAAARCKYVDKVYVATDSDRIKESVEHFCHEASCFNKVEVIGRSAESASDTASTESAMLEFAENYDFDNIALVQATSPLLDFTDLERGFELFDSEGCDSVLSVVEQKRFTWSIDGDGIASPTNYDVYHRPRRQEFSPYYVENGAFYITSKEDLLKSKNRVSGQIKACVMNEDTFLEIDEPADFTIIEAIMKRKGVKPEGDIPYAGLPDIKMVLTDCDGCLTDGGMYYTEKGDELKKFNTRDGTAVALLRKQGILTGIITGENVTLNKRRVDKLNMDYYVPACHDKIAALKNICEESGIDIKNVAYIGDDIIDVDALKAVGFSACPSDAVAEVKEVAHYVAKAKGGEGVLREVAELILESAR